MRYRPTESDFSVAVVLHPESRIETFKYRGSELICEACGPDFQTAMIHTAAGGIAIGEPGRPRLGPSAWRLKLPIGHDGTTGIAAVEGSRHGSWLFGEFTVAQTFQKYTGNPEIIP